MNDDFYIGYRDQSSAALARHTRGVVGVASLLLVAVVALVAALQTPADPGTFEFGITHAYEGVIRETPLPLLRTVSPEGSVTHYLLVGAGKHGLPAFARGHDGQRVRFEGTLIQRGAASMIEMNRPDSFRVLDDSIPSTAHPRVESVGEVVLSGELVDTKCWFGVMRPAEGKVHRACAVRCLSGGVPPGVLLRDDRGNGVVVLLTDADGAALSVDPQWAARVVRVGGVLEYREDLAVLRVRTLALDDGSR